MQQLSEIRGLLKKANVRPKRRLGQSFLIDQNLMGKLLELAAISPDSMILEVGPGTGSLTEELLDRAGRVVTVEIDKSLAGLLDRRLGPRRGLRLICGDILAGKHELNGQVLEALGGCAALVANLPYNIATPLVALCLQESWKVLSGQGRCRFQSLTFTVQREVADRLSAGPGSKSYGPVSVLVGLMGGTRVGRLIGPTAFWPQPKVQSRMLRIDFDPERAARIHDARKLRQTLQLAFGQRRKTIGSIFRHKPSPFTPDQAAHALATAGIDPASRPERVSPEQFLALAEAIGPESSGS